VTENFQLLTYLQSNQLIKLIHLSYPSWVGFRNILPLSICLMSIKIGQLYPYKENTAKLKSAKSTPRKFESAEEISVIAFSLSNIILYYEIFTKNSLLKL